MRRVDLQSIRSVLQPAAYPTFKWIWLNQINIKSASTRWITGHKTLLHKQYTYAIEKIAANIE